MATERKRLVRDWGGSNGDVLSNRYLEFQLGMIKSSENGKW